MANAQKRSRCYCNCFSHNRKTFWRTVLFLEFFSGARVCTGESRQNTLTKLIAHNHDHDRIDRRGFLQCMAWAGTGIIWTLEAGVPVSRAFGQKTPSSERSFSFVQISDSHIGFNKPANQDVTATLQVALDKIAGLQSKPDFILHTGDLTHGARPEEFDTLEQMMKTSRDTFYVPGEHDTSTDDGKAYMERYGRNVKGSGWYSFDHAGVHLLGLSNVMAQEGLGQAGRRSACVDQR